MRLLEEKMSDENERLAESNRTLKVRQAKAKPKSQLVNGLSDASSIDTSECAAGYDRLKSRLSFASSIPIAAHTTRNPHSSILFK